MSLTKKAYESFKHSLHDGQIEGGKTYSQNEICVLLGQSISPVREALKLLEHEGFVDVHPRAGIEVLKPDLEMFRECYQFRRLIEMAAIDHYVDRVSDDELALLRHRQVELRKRIVSKLPMEDLQPTHWRVEEWLHTGIVGALNNKMIMQAYRICWEKQNLVRIDQGTFTTSQLVSAADQHLAIIDAAIARDVPAARAALDEHLKESLSLGMGAVALSDGFI
ncbi:MAG: GntR family transcriptional regulator [Pseudomonadota bacterium]